MMMRAKLLVFHPVIAPYRIDFFNELNQHFDTKICLFKRNLSSQKFDYSKIEAQLNFKPVYIERKKNLLKWMKDILLQIRMFRPDIVLCSEFGISTIVAILFNLFMEKKYRIVSMVDDSYNMVAEGNQFSWKHSFATRLVTHFLDDVINVEPRVKAFYQKKYGKGIYMPIIVDEGKARDRLRRIIPLSHRYVEQYKLEGKKVLLFVGRLVGIKNVEFALKAFRNINKSDCVFVIVGDGPEKTSLEKLSKDCSNVVFTGRLEGDSLYAWYNVAQIFTLPSRQEPFGAVTNEALVGGCYALVSKLAGSSCLLKENENGNVIDPYNLDAYEKTLCKRFELVKPISLPLRLRTNLMNVRFRECVENVIAHLERN